MADRPILFSGPMVRALLASTKTQTRRDLTKTFARFPQLDGYETNGTLKQIEGRSVPCVEFVHSKLGLWDPETNPGGRSGWYVPLKAAVGDRLYVREHWRTHAMFDDIAPRDLQARSIHYCADGEINSGKHRQAMHMPRWASRLTLSVTDVRVERLQDISEQDCVAEGIEWVTRTSSGNFYRNFDAPEIPIMAYGAYRSLWNHINGSDAWDKNPWVVAYTFSVQRGNIDQIARAA
ncbi:hypothetical protein [Rhizobium leguminosarum]|uniref:hypothetical protein n=1 Tax=Rhizobium leguminosarum TaxID=384 RepID=UPI001C8FAB66|nr:hypothetical protein [Rhizobium leguminosarum]MBY2986430.1 hypothetical protein [Rhizobium leguminosarum]